MFKKLTALVLVIGCATIYVQNYYSYSPQRGNVTRTDLTPEEIMKNNTQNTQLESKTTAGACVGINAGIVGYKTCVDNEGTISVSANAVGLQATIYDNPKTGNMGGGIGIGGELRIGSVGVGASTIICGDKEKGLVAKTSVSGGPVQTTTTTYDKNR